MFGNITAQQAAEWDENRRGPFIGALIAFCIIANISCGVKFVVQYRTLKTFLAEDFFILIALACSNAVVSCYFEALRYGLGYHIWRIEGEDLNKPQRLINIFYWIWIPSVLNGPIFTTVKLSLLLLYHRLFMVNQTWFKIAWWANLVYIIMWFIGSTLYYIFSCTPPSYYWERLYIFADVTPPHPVHGHCVRTNPSDNELPLVFGLISDLGILALPVITLTGLQLHPRRKLGSLLLFSFGSLVIVLEVARIVILETKTGLASYGDMSDPTYNMITFEILTCAVETTAIVCACIPVVVPQTIKGLRDVRRLKSISSTGSTRRLVEKVNRYFGSSKSSEIGDNGSDKAGLEENSIQNHPSQPVNQDSQSSDTTNRHEIMLGAGFMVQRQD